jgi:hypothetical protein
MQTVQVSALNNRVPSAVLVIEVVGASVALGLLALYLAILARGVISVVLAAAFVSVLLLITFDLDRPVRGLVTVPNTPLVSLRFDGAAACSPRTRRAIKGLLGRLRLVPQRLARVIASACSHSGLDVLVESEEVGRVVGALELDQPLVVSRAIGLANPVAALFAEEVHVHAPPGVRLQRVVEVPRPGDVAFCVRILLGPNRVDCDVVGGIALGEGGCVLWHATERPAELEDDGV